MGKVIASASLSLDGYIAKDDNAIGRFTPEQRPQRGCRPQHSGRRQ
jgi:hypothetical protein